VRTFSPTVDTSEVEESIRCVVHYKAAVLKCHDSLCQNFVVQSPLYLYQARALIIVMLVWRIISCTPIHYHLFVVSRQMGLSNVRYCCVSVICCLLSVIQWNFSWLKHNERTSQLVFLASVAVSRSISLRIPLWDIYLWDRHCAVRCARGTCMDICNIFYMSLHATTATRSGSLKRSSSFKKLLKLPIWSSGEWVLPC
jgi:hypothetical protein